MSRENEALRPIAYVVKDALLRAQARNSGITCFPAKSVGMVFFTNSSGVLMGGPMLVNHPDKDVEPALRALDTFCAKEVASPHDGPDVAAHNWGWGDEDFNTFFTGLQADVKAFTEQYLA